MPNRRVLDFSPLAACITQPHRMPFRDDMRLQCVCACVLATVPQLSVLTGALGPKVARQGQLGIMQAEHLCLSWPKSIGLKRQQFSESLRSMSAIWRSAVATVASRRTPPYRWDPALFRSVASRANMASTRDCVSALRLRRYRGTQSAQPGVSETSKSLSPGGYTDIGRSRRAPSSSLSCGLRGGVVAAKALVRIRPSACGPHARSPGRRSLSPVCISCISGVLILPRFPRKVRHGLPD